ncbi:MAG TPA: hypothetical protein VFZ70_11405 [Euzebyales bacterium]
MRSLSHLRRHLDGPPYALPAALDACSERWWRTTPRRRALALVAAFLAVVAVGQWWTAHVHRRWGGPARRALIAVEHANVGDRPQVRSVLLPPAMVPADAPRSVDGDERLALALPASAVLTRAHLSPEGPAAGLDPELRAVPLPVPPGLEVTAGGTVDVWVLEAAPDRSRRVAERRPVLRVSAGDDPVALVGLATAEVAATMRGLAGGDVLLTQAPP